MGVRSLGGCEELDAASDAPHDDDEGDEGDGEDEGDDSPHY